MAVQITGRQIANAAVDVNKLDLSSGTFDFQSAVLQVATPSADSHAATKGYVDSISQGLHWKDSVKVATTANITLSGTQTIDGVAISADQRVLVKNQSTGSENGIYLCKAGAWERAADMNAAAEFSGSAVFVQQGTTNADTGYVCTNDGDVTVGTTAITFAQFTGAGQVEAGAALTKTGNRLDVAVDDSSLEISSDALQIKAAGVTNAMLAGSIANGKLANSTISGVALGSNLNSLSAGNGLSMTSFNGSAAVSDLTIDLDGSSLAVGSDGIKVADGGVTNAMLAGSIAASKLAGSIPADKLNLSDGVEDDGGNLKVKLDGSSITRGTSGIKVSDGGIGSTQLAATSVTTAKIANAAITNAKLSNDSVKTDNLDFAGFFQGFDANGSTAAFEMAGPIDLEFKEFFTVAVNGLLMEYKASPDAQDNYKIDNGGAGGAGRIVFGSNLSNGDRVTIRAFVNN